MATEIEAGGSSEDGVGRAPGGVLIPPESDIAPTVSVVLPTMNEEAGIAECIERIRTALRALGTTGEIVVSDSSSDRTPEIAREMGAIVVTPDRDGYGSAYRYAFEHVRGKYVVLGDADTTYDFEELPRLFDRLQESDAEMVVGNRLAGDIEGGAMPPLHQYVGNPLLTRFLNAFYDAGVGDAHSGFRVLPRETLEELELHSEGMEFASEMIMEAGRQGMHIAEVPITYRKREGEPTLDSFRDGWRHVKFMLVNAPGYLFSLPGLLMVAVGITQLALGVSDVTLWGMSFGIHTMLAGSLLTIVGAQVGSFGTFATLAGNPIRAPTDPISEWITERIRLEHGATFGLLVFGLGATYEVAMLSRWVASGFTRLPFLPGDIIALTAVVLGVQMVFSSFFLSIVAGCTSDC